jgi:hypothetical protein
LESKLSRLSSFAWLTLCIFPILSLGISCSRYPNAAAAQTYVVGERTLGVGAATHAPSSDPSLISKWNMLVRETIEQSARERSVVLIINKCRHTLSAYKNGYRVAEYVVGLSPNTLCEHDATPEGKYQIVNKVGPEETKYQRAFIVTLSSAQARQPFRTLPLKSRKRVKIGANLAIYAAGNKDQESIGGAFALDNEALDELFPHVTIGTPVTIVPNEAVQPDRGHHRVQ